MKLKRNLAILLCFILTFSCVVLLVGCAEAEQEAIDTAKLKGQQVSEKVWQKTFDNSSFNNVTIKFLRNYKCEACGITLDEEEGISIFKLTENAAFYMFKIEDDYDVSYEKKEEGSTYSPGAIAESLLNEIFYMDTVEIKNLYNRLEWSPSARAYVGKDIISTNSNLEIKIRNGKLISIKNEVVDKYGEKIAVTVEEIIFLDYGATEIVFPDEE